MSESHSKIAEIVNYMRAHWPSQVKPEWQVSLEEYPELAKTAFIELTQDKTRNKTLVRIAGLSGSGKTSQLLPATEAYFATRNQKPVLVAAREFVKYHPHHDEIKDFYGEEKLRPMTDEFSTIMLFLVITELIKNGYDIILDVTLLAPEMEAILQEMLVKSGYTQMILMIALSPVITEHFLAGRAWRHTKATEQEFIRATAASMKFYAEHFGDTRIILWSVYDKPPIFDGKIRDSLDIFTDYSARETLPKKDDDERREAKIDYLKSL